MLSGCGASCVSCRSGGALPLRPAPSGFFEDCTELIYAHLNSFEPSSEWERHAETCSRDNSLVCSTRLWRMDQTQTAAPHTPKERSNTPAPYAGPWDDAAANRPRAETAGSMPSRTDVQPSSVVISDHGIGVVFRLPAPVLIRN